MIFMGRTPKDRRGNYRNDSRGLALLADAVLADSVIPADAKRQIVSHLNEVKTKLDEITINLLPRML